MSEGSSESSMSEYDEESTAIKSGNSTEKKRENKKEAKSRLKALKANISGGWATQKELQAWYWFDFANSPFYQVLTGVIYPLMLLYLGNDAACPYHDKVVNFNYPGGNFTSEPLQTTCLYNFTNEDDEWGSWTDYVIEDGYNLTDALAPGKVTCQSLPSWIPTDYDPEVSGLFRNKTFNTTYDKSVDFTTWSWTLLANLTDDEAENFRVAFNDTMLKNVSVLVHPESEASSGTSIHRITVNATVNGWYYGLSFMKLYVDSENGTMPDTEFVMAAMINSTRCYGTLNMGIMTVSATAFAGTVISLSIFVQAFLFVSFSGLGDHLDYRKKIMLRCAYFAAFVILMNGVILILDPFPKNKNYIFSALCVILANGLYGLSIVMYNAYLPFLALAHPRMKEASKSAGKDAEKILAVYISIEDEISHKGFAWGYLGGCSCLLVSIVLLMMDPSMFSMYLINVLVAMWFIAFATPAIRHLEPRPGPPLPRKWQGGLRWLAYGYYDTAEVLKNIKTLPHTCRFFVCYFWYSDAYNTITHVAVLFAEAEFNVGTMELTMLALIVPMFCFIGCVIQMKLENTYFKGRSQKWFIEQNLLALGLVVAFGLLGSIPGMPIGMVNSWELWPFACLYGLILGPVQSFSRVLMSDLTPPGLEAEFYSAFELTDKGSSWMGPLICAILYETTGTMRTGFWYLFLGCIGPYFGLKYFVDVDQGRKDTKSLKTMVWVKKRRQHKRKAKKQARGEIGSNVRTSQMSSSAASSNVFSKLKRKSKSNSVAPMSATESMTSTVENEGSSMQSSDSDSDPETMATSSVVQSSAVEASEVEEAVMEETVEEEDEDN